MDHIFGFQLLQHCNQKSSLREESGRAGTVLRQSKGYFRNDYLGFIDGFEIFTKL